MNVDVARYGPGMLTISLSPSGGWDGPTLVQPTVRRRQRSAILFRSLHAAPSSIALTFTGTSETLYDHFS
jgi:hypothetical protein